MTLFEIFMIPGLVGLAAILGVHALGTLFRNGSL